MLVKAYQIFWSSFFGGSCRFYPSCSEYAVEALQTYKLITAFRLIIMRVLSCHPLGSKGFDPVPCCKITNHKSRCLNESE